MIMVYPFPDFIACAPTLPPNLVFILMFCSEILLYTQVSSYFVTVITSSAPCSSSFLLEFPSTDVLCILGQISFVCHICRSSSSSMMRRTMILRSSQGMRLHTTDRFFFRLSFFRSRLVFLSLRILPLFIFNKKMTVIFLNNRIFCCLNKNLYDEG